MVIYKIYLIFSALKVFQGFPLRTFAPFALKSFDVALRFDINHVNGELVSVADQYQRSSPDLCAEIFLPGSSIPYDKTREHAELLFSRFEDATAFIGAALAAAEFRRPGAFGGLGGLGGQEAFQFLFLAGAESAQRVF